ncbi:uncharacterized protein [Diadema antillarum]|uniref:uncharacterized protein n=1 Tax=Diadema antillarum TaxID=105358 RepID=UPI003A88B1ED
MAESTHNRRTCVFVILASFVAQVTAQYFLEEPRDIEVIQGGLALFRCTVTDIRDDFNVYWRFVADGSLVPLSLDRDVKKYASYHGDRTRRLSITGDANHGEYNLRIKNISMVDQGQYVCTVITSDKVAHDSRRASLILRPRHPVNTAIPDPLPACSMGVLSSPYVTQIGAVIRLTCASPAGSPSRKLVWKRQPSNAPSTELVTCPGSPCEHNRKLLWEDVDTKFVCEILPEFRVGLARPAHPGCSLTPLDIKNGVVIDPVVANVLTGERVGFLCVPINSSPSQLMFHWYQNSQIIPNGTDMSLLNLMIDRNDDNSTISCVVSSLDGAFLGIGFSQIKILDADDIFPGIEGSSPTNFPTEETTDTPKDTKIIDGSAIYATTVWSGQHNLSQQPIAEITNNGNGSKHLSISIVGYAIAAALLICAVGRAVVLFVRKRKSNGDGKGTESAHEGKGSGTSAKFEMNAIPTSGLYSETANYHETNELNERNDPIHNFCTDDNAVSTDKYYAVLDPDGEEEYVDSAFLKEEIAKGDSNEESASTIAVPCTPNEYARPTNRTLEFDRWPRQNEGQGTEEHHERNPSDSSASAYAVTDVVSQRGRFVFKGMTGRDEADVGICRNPSFDRSASMSKARDRSRNAPPLPVRTLPRTLSTPGRPVDVSEARKEGRALDSVQGKNELKSKRGFSSLWPWSGRNKKASLSTSVKNEKLPQIPNSPEESTDQDRRLSLGSAGSGDYAEISIRRGSSAGPVENGEYNLVETNFPKRERLHSIPERLDMTNGDIQPYTVLHRGSRRPRSAVQESSDSDYDRLMRPSRVLSAEPKKSAKIPVYAKVQKSKSLDHGQSLQKKSLSNSETTSGSPPNSLRKSEKSSSTPFTRSMSEGAAPCRGKVPSTCAGYETVETIQRTEKLDSILVQIRNSFPGQTLDEPDENANDSESVSTGSKAGGHFAKIV